MADPRVPSTAQCSTPICPNWHYPVPMDLPRPVTSVMVICGPCGRTITNIKESP